jgi:hypothetical protein
MFNIIEQGGSAVGANKRFVGCSQNHETMGSIATVKRA